MQIRKLTSVASMRLKALISQTAQRMKAHILHGPLPFPAVKLSLPFHTPPPPPLPPTHPESSTRDDLRVFPKPPGREIAKQHGEPLPVNGGLLLHLTTAHQLELPPSAPEQRLLVTLLAVLTIHITSLLHHPIFVPITSNKFSIFNGYAKLSDMSTNKNGQYVFQVNKELKQTNQHKQIKNRHCTIFSKQYYNSKTGSQRVN